MGGTNGGYRCRSSEAPSIRSQIGPTFAAAALKCRLVRLAHRRWRGGSVGAQGPRVGAFRGLEFTTGERDQRVLYAAA
jgi:hypothetical protein